MGKKHAVSALIFQYFLFCFSFVKYESILLSGIHNATVVCGGWKTGITKPSEGHEHLVLLVLMGGPCLGLGRFVVKLTGGATCYEEWTPAGILPFLSYLGQMLVVEAEISHAELPCSEICGSCNYAIFFCPGNTPLLPKLLAIDPPETLPWPLLFFRRPVLHAEVHWQYLKPVLPVKFSHRQTTDPFSNCASQCFFCLELFKVPEQISRHWENQPWYSFRKKFQYARQRAAVPTLKQRWCCPDWKSIFNCL